jgi:excisionase family DNA binding protein
MFVNTDASRLDSSVAKGFATEEGREETANASRMPSDSNLLREIHARVTEDHFADAQAQRVQSDAEFEPLLGVTEAAKLLRIHPKTLRIKAGHGIIPGVQIGRVWRFRASVLNRWLESITGQPRR